MSIQEIKIPDIGDFKDVPVLEILISNGDSVEIEQSIMTLESDKATLDIPSPSAGIVKELKIKEGDIVSEGVVFMTMEITAVDSAPTIVEEAPKEPEPEPEQVIEKTEETEDYSAGPAVRKLARDLEIDLTQIKGTGRNGRILKEDIKQAIKTPSNSPTIPEIDFNQFGETEITPLSRIKKISGTSLQRSWLNIPHVTQFDEADITELEKFRKELAPEAQKRELKVTLLSLLMKATVVALKQYPDFNASLDTKQENLILKKYYHIGVAVETPNGLVVPVIKDVDKKGIFELAANLTELSKKARDGKLSPTDMQGASFTISSLGGIGGTAFTPIVNAPEVAILGVSRSKMQPIYQDGEFVPRLMLPLSLSYDHRVIDGAAGARFTRHLSFLLSDVRHLLF
ncbi:dihydrolipoyllysine-residue acetyltransferase [Candidatus Marithrix sp. Canyon 246]|uniref:dihydrolipoyllysine-residue acetyltransferase n=1 Tax=Candidatus Marithrix sp. Canyon 246 TaxID=1827136 RepID=UPI000849F519|nr:dihydrolipoyllysine-residue acetyltransferase [Candidatus Marithrix sp. Canyon 246]